jgi:hypothetical protein
VSLVEIDDDSPEFLLSKTRIAELERKKRFFVTCSQNNTPVDKGFWATVQHYLAENGSELLVLPIRYRNPTSAFNKQDEDVWWPDEVLPHLVENIVKIHPELWIMANMRIQATAVNPLTGLETMSQHASAIYGHTQLQMKTIPTPQNALPKQLWTTGTCSVKNYSKTKAGVKGSHHHTVAGIVVEKKGKKFHTRPVIWDGECFYDLDKKYTANGVEYNQRIDALVTGDEHVTFNDPLVKQATYMADNCIAKVLRPKVVVRHDVFDGYSISHHHRYNPVTQYVKWREGINNVEAELQATIDFIEETTPDDCSNVIIASNHNEHLYRWLRDSDWKIEPWNAQIYHWFWYHMLNEATFDTDGAKTFDPFAYWAEKSIDPKCPTKFLERDESYTRQGIELSLHGDIGLNGARGSAVGLNKIGIRSIIGHGHSPCIEKGVTQMGTSTYLSLEYNTGPSSWMNTHALIYSNGKRALVNVIDGCWRG